MEITIVIPVRNRAAIVERALCSVEAQTYRPLKVILVDNGSTDGTPAVLERWRQSTASAPDFVVSVINEPAPGAAVARNAGLAAVDTEWTMFFDSDDIMLPDHVDRAMKCARKHPDAGIIGWDVKVQLPSGREKGCPFFSSDMLYGNIIHGGMATLRYMARTEIFRRAGGWNEAIEVWDDIELGTRLLLLDPVPRIYKVNGSPRVLTYFTVDSLTGPLWSDKAEGRSRDIDVIEGLLPRKYRWIASMKRAQLARVMRKEGRKDLADRVMRGISGTWWQRRVCRLGAWLPSDALRPFL